MATKPRKKITSAGNVRWEVVIRKAGYPQVSKMHKTEKAALEWAIETEYQIAKGTYVFSKKLQDKMQFKQDGSGSNISETMTLAELFTVYFDKYSSTLKDGGDKDKSRIKPIIEYMGSVRLCDLSKSTIIEYATMRLNSKGFRKKVNLSGGTVKHEINIIKRVINVALDVYEIKLTNGNPAIFSRGSPISKMLKGGQRDRVLRDNEQARLFEACRNSNNKELIDIVLIALETSMRRGEVVSLTWKAIDFDRKVVYIPVPNDKGGDGRYVALTDSAIEILKSIREGNDSSDGNVFESTGDHAQKSFAEACKEAGIVDFKIHDLRHTAITRTANRTGMHILQLMQYSGHKSMEMVKRYYKDDIDDVVRILNKKP
ncbi:site-specific integrase [Acidithiobacillus ferrivorans]|nr:site-specific integrase [Acidithiobacillus ferrivorans]